MKKYPYLLILILIFISACTDEYAVERSIVIDAPKEIVWEQIKYFKNWENWSPWFANDSTMEVTFEGVDGNVESSYAWIGEFSGNGGLTNIGLTEGEELLYSTDFIEPWNTKSEGYLRLVKLKNGQTEVKWGFTGENKGFTSIFLNMDEFVGPDLEKGLNLLKVHSEKIAEEQNQLKVEEIDFEATNFMAVRGSIDVVSIQSFFVKTLSKIKENDVESFGYPTGIYYSWDMENMQCDMAAAIPVAKGTKAIEGTEIIQFPKSKALMINFPGNYKSISEAHELMETYLIANQIEFIGPVIEEYVTEPMVDKNPSESLTKVIYLVK